MTDLREDRQIVLSVDGGEYQIEVIEIPFREGVELLCRIGDDEVRVSDRQLGEYEAVRLMEVEIRARLAGQLSEGKRSGAER